MKKSLFTLAIFLGALSLMLTSCDKDPLDMDPDEWGGSYKIVLDGKVVAEGDTEEIGLLFNIATVGNGDALNVLVAGVPGSVGGVSQIEDDDNEAEGAVTIMGINLLKDDGSDEMYFSASGSIKRESTSKITFEGICTSIDSLEPINFSGTIESKAFKLI